MSPQQQDFIRRAFQAAVDAHHVFAAMAACEAALESGYGHSVLAELDNNLFGMKQHQHPLFQTISLPTREFLNGEFVATEANWIRYPDWQSCFEDRMATLQRLAPQLSHYRDALNAATGADYVRAVSMTWSTDPQRAQKVLAIYNSVAGDWSKSSAIPEST